MTDVLSVILSIILPHRSQQFSARANWLACWIAFIKASVYQAISRSAGHRANQILMRVRSRHWLVLGKIIGEMPLLKLV